MTASFSAELHAIGQAPGAASLTARGRGSHVQHSQGRAPFRREAAPLTRSMIERLQLLALLVVGAAAAGGLYSLVLAPPGFGRTDAHTTGAAVGTVISGCVIGFE